MDEDSRWDSLVAQADAYRRAGNADKLADVAGELMALRPEDEYGYRQAGEAAIAEDDYDEAVAWMTKAVAAEPEYGFLHYRLAVAHRLNDDTAAAEKAVHVALELDPTYPWAWVELGEISYIEDDYEGAAEFARRALELDAEHVAARQLLVRSLKEEGRSTRDERMELLDQALSIDPDDADVWDDKALLLLEMKRWEEAEACARQALLLRPDSSHYRRTLYKTLRRRSWMYRILRAPGDFVGWGFGLINRIGWPAWIALCVVGIGGRLFLILVVLGVVWGVAVWPLLKLYEWLSMRELRAEAREIEMGGRRGVHAMPRMVRQLLFLGGAFVYWSVLGRVLSTEGGRDVATTVLLVAILLALLLGLWATWLVIRDNRRARKRRQRVEQEHHG